MIEGIVYIFGVYDYFFQKHPSHRIHPGSERRMDQNGNAKCTATSYYFKFFKKTSYGRGLQNGQSGKGTPLVRLGWVT